MLRLYMSVDPPPAAVDHLRAVVGELAVSRANAPGRSTRVADPHQWHLTVAFLGEVPAERVPAATEAMARAAAATPEPIRLRLAGGGRFGRGTFTVLWAGVGGDLAAFRLFAGGLRRELRRARLPHDRRPLRPHLTIARPGDRVSAAGITADLHRLRAYEGPQWRVERVHLMRSELGPQPVYTRLATAELAG